MLIRLDTQDLEDLLAGIDAERDQAKADIERIRTAVANYDVQLSVLPHMMLLR